MNYKHVIPAKAGIQEKIKLWIPACADMTKWVYLLLFSSLILTGCGIKGDLVRPSDIPAYEKERQEKRGPLPI